MAGQLVDIIEHLPRRTPLEAAIGESPKTFLSMDIIIYFWVGLETPCLMDTGSSLSAGRSVQARNPSVKYGEFVSTYLLRASRESRNEPISNGYLFERAIDAANPGNNRSSHVTRSQISGLLFATAKRAQISDWVTAISAGFGDERRQNMQLESQIRFVTEPIMPLAEWSAILPTFWWCS